MLLQGSVVNRLQQLEASKHKTEFCGESVVVVLKEGLDHQQYCKSLPGKVDIHMGDKSGGVVKLTSSGRKTRNRYCPSAGTGGLSPGDEGSFSKDPMVKGSDLVASDSEQILNRTVHGKKALCLSH